MTGGWVEPKGSLWRANTPKLFVFFFNFGHFVACDGDEEDLDENEVREGLALLERERGGPSKEKGTSRAGRKRQSFDAAALQGKRSKHSKK